MCTIYGVLLGDEAGGVDVPNPQRRITLTDVVLEVGIDLNCPLLLGLLLDDGESCVVEEHRPSQPLGIADTESEECSAPDIKAHCIIFVPIELSDKGEHRVPREIIASRMMGC